MDRLIAEKEVETETKIDTNTEEKTVPTQALPEIEAEKNPPVKNSYLNSFENLTVADIKKQEKEKKAEEFKRQKEELIQQQYDSVKEESAKVFQNIIEKPNYDLIEENKKIVKLSKKSETKKINKKKVAGLVMACTLGASALICVTNTIILDNMNSSVVQIDKTYNINLVDYLKNINNLDATKKGMEFIETYPDELLDAGDLGKQSNWFDKLCSFLGGLFGG